MNITTVIGVVVALAVVGGGGWYLSQQGAFEGMMGPSQEAENEATDNPAPSSGTLADIMRFSGSVRCEVETTDPNAVSSGIVYVTDGEMRADFTSTVAGKAYDSHMIRAEGKLYTWSSAASQGMVMEESEAQASASGSAQASTALDPSVSVNYSCHPWVADDALFAPPSEVTFMDFSAMMQGGAGMQLPKMPY